MHGCTPHALQQALCDRIPYVNNQWSQNSLNSEAGVTQCKEAELNQTF